MRATGNPKPATPRLQIRVNCLMRKQNESQTANIRDGIRHSEPGIWRLRFDFFALLRAVPGGNSGGDYDRPGGRRRPKGRGRYSGVARTALSRLGQLARVYPGSRRFYDRI